MYVTCPMCDTRYNLRDSIPSGSRATVVCTICATQLEVEPRGVAYAYIPKVTVRQAQLSEEEKDEIKQPVVIKQELNG